jgi:hypothetical protein
VFDFSIASLIPSFVFGVFGFWMIRQSRARGNPSLLIVGVLMLGYTYFVSNAWLDWGIGIGLCYWAYKIW